MIRLMDNSGVVEIEMFDGNGRDFSADFFRVWNLKRNEKKGAYVVPDVCFCLDRASDWKNGVGDYEEDYAYLSADERQKRLAQRHLNYYDI